MVAAIALYAAVLFAVSYGMFRSRKGIGRTALLLGAMTVSAIVCIWIVRWVSSTL